MPLIHAESFQMSYLSIMKMNILNLTLQVPPCHNIQPTQNGVTNKYHFEACVFYKSYMIMTYMSDFYFCSDATILDKCSPSSDLSSGGMTILTYFPEDLYKEQC